MTPTPITKKQFVGWLIVFTFGMALWAFLGEGLWFIGMGIVAFSNFILMTPHERSRPLPGREVLWVFGGLIVFAILMFAAKRWLPDDFGAPLARAMRHPAVVAVLWSLLVWLTYRRCRVTDTGLAA